MPQDCFKRCPLTGCSRFFRCPDHWDADELAEMAPDPDAIAPPCRPDLVEPDLLEDKP